MTDIPLSLNGWLAFLKSLSAGQAPERVEALLAGQRAVLDHALRQSGRSREADVLKAASIGLGSPVVSITALAAVSEDLTIAQRGLQRHLPLNAMLAADIGEAALLLRAESGLATSPSAQALVMRVDKLLDAVATRAAETLGQLDEVARSFADPNSGPARLLADQIAGWRADLAALRGLRRFSADLSLTNDRLETLRRVEPLVGELYQAGLLSDTGRRARLEQAAGLLAQESAPRVEEAPLVDEEPSVAAAPSAPLQPFDLASVVDHWQPRPVNAAPSSARYLADMKRRSSLLTSPPGRIWDRGERFDTTAALEEVQWLIRAGQPEEGERSLRTALPHLHKTERSDVRWIAAAADLGLSGLTADMAIAGLALANGSENSSDRYIDRIALIAARCEAPEFVERVEADSGKDPERACAAAFLLAVKGRSSKALTLIGGTESVRGPVFFRLIQAYPADVPDGQADVPDGEADVHVMATDKATAAWAAGLPGGAGGAVSLLEWPGATPGEASRSLARTVVTAAAMALEACDIPVAPELADESAEMRLAGLVEGFMEAWSAAATPGQFRVALGADRLDDALALTVGQGADMSAFGVGASRVRVERLRLARAGVEPAPVRIDRRRRILIAASYEAFLAGLGAPRDPALAWPETNSFSAESWWARQIAEAAAAQIGDSLAPGPCRAALRRTVASAWARSLIHCYTAYILTADRRSGAGTRRIPQAVAWTS